MPNGCNGWWRSWARALPNAALLALPLLAISATGAGAQTIPNPRFSLPIDCEIGVSCFIQNYVDRDPTPGPRRLSLRPPQLRQAQREFWRRRTGLSKRRGTASAMSTCASQAPLLKGSVVVKKGDRIKRGQRLGSVGLSGLTEFPHLHFEVHFNQSVIDPFTAGHMRAVCDSTTNSVDPKRWLWATPVGKMLAYVGTGLIQAGFTDRNRTRPPSKSASTTW